MNIVNRNLTGEISPSMKEYAERKLSFPEFSVEDVKLVVSSVNDEIFIRASFSDSFNHHYNLSVNRADYYEAVDVLKDLMFSALTRRKQKIAARKSDGYFYEELPEVVKEKVLIASAMSLDQAISEMQDLGHDFFIFRNEDNDIAVLYNRYDGGLGIINVR